MFELSKRLLYYKRKDVQKAILSYCENREVGIKYNDYFGKRPDVLVYENDVLEFVKKGATSFHISEERWQNPLEINPDLKKNEVDKLRIGWDLVLDIDCPYWYYSKLTTYLFIKALKQHGIESISCKFSGNKGFHIGVPFETFPTTVNNVNIKDWFPEGPKKIASYLVNYVSKNFIKYDKNIVYFDNIHKVSLKELTELAGKTDREFIIKRCSFCYKNKCICGKNDYKDYFDSLSFVNVDTILLSPRHLFRAPFSMHEKTGLVSIPIMIGKVLTFEKELAKTENVFPDKMPIFLDKKKVRKNESEKLLIASFDYETEDKKFFDFINGTNIKKLGNLTNDTLNNDGIPIELFPPCILKILKGLEDGRKRSLFVLVNFLTSINWTYDKIESLLLEWNKKNKEPLKESLIKLQIKYHKQKQEKYLPPNCREYYKEFGVCNPDNLCDSIKNPVQYSKKRMFLLKGFKGKKRERKKLTEEQKEMRRRYRENLKKEKINNMKNIDNDNITKTNNDVNKVN